MTVARAQAGFAVLETILIVGILGVLSGTGYFVWHAKQTADKSLDAATQSSPTADGLHVFSALGYKLPTNWFVDLNSKYSVSLSSGDKQCVVQGNQTDMAAARTSDPEATISALEKQVGKTDTNGYSTKHQATSTLKLRTWQGEQTLTAYNHDTVNPSGKTVNYSETAYIVSDGHYDSVMLSCVSQDQMNRAEEAAGALQIKS